MLIKPSDKRGAIVIPSTDHSQKFSKEDWISQTTKHSLT